MNLEIKQIKKEKELIDFLKRDLYKVKKRLKQKRDKIERIFCEIDDHEEYIQNLETQIKNIEQNLY